MTVATRRSPGSPEVTRRVPAPAAGTNLTPEAFRDLLARHQCNDPQPGDAETLRAMAIRRASRRRMAGGACDRPARQGAGARLRWSASEHGLAHLMWEASHDGARPLAADPELTVAVTRLVPDTATGPPTPIQDVPRALCSCRRGTTRPDRAARGHVPRSRTLLRVQPACCPGQGPHRRHHREPRARGPQAFLTACTSSTLSPTERATPPAWWGLRLGGQA